MRWRTVRWDDDEEITVIGDHLVQRIPVRNGRVSSAPPQLVTLSSVDRFAFHPSDGQIVAEVAGDVYRYAGRRWSRSDEPFRAAAPSLTAGAWRVSLENLQRGDYANTVITRNSRSLDTSPLFPYPRREYDPFPERSTLVDLENFSHGSRNRRREVSFAINATHSDIGLRGGVTHP